MKAGVYYETGSPELFRYGEVPDPVCETIRPGRIERAVAVAD